VDVVGRSVEWIDDPDCVLSGAAIIEIFFAEERVIGELTSQPVDDGRLGRLVSLGDEVCSTFFAHGEFPLPVEEHISGE